MQFHVPTVEEFSEALPHVKLTKAQLAILKAHAATGDVGMTAADLAQAGDYADYSTTNLHYGKVGRALADEIGIALPIYKSSGRDGPTGVLATWQPTPNDPDSIGRWVMHRELRASIAESFDP